MKKTAVVITKRCPYFGKRLYGVRIEKRGIGWFRTWSFPLSESVAKQEKFSSQMDLSDYSADSKYPGCPYCSGDDFVQCERCKKISCYKGESIVVCPWCGSKERVVFEEWDPVSGGGY